MVVSIVLVTGGIPIFCWWSRSVVIMPSSIALIVGPLSCPNPLFMFQAEGSCSHLQIVASDLYFHLFTKNRGSLRFMPCHAMPCPQVEKADEDDCFNFLCS